MTVTKISRNILLGLAGLIVLLVLGFGALLAFVDPNSFRPQIERAASEFGVRVELQGDIGWHFYPYIGFDLDRVRLYPQGSGQHLLQLGTLSLSLHLTSLLKGRIEVRGIEMLDAELRLEKDAQGQGNWQRLMADKPPLQQAQQAHQESTEPPVETHRSQTMVDLKQLQLGFVDIRNFLLVYRDASSDLQAELIVERLVLKDARFDNWFPVELNVSARLNKPAIATDLVVHLQAMLAADPAKLQLRDLRLAMDTTAQPLGEASQHIVLSLDRVLFDQASQRIDARELVLDGELQLAQLANNAQKITLRSDLSFGLEAQRASLSQFELDADLLLPQMGEARQSLSMAGDMNLALKTRTLSTPQMTLEANLNYPQFLTQQLAVKGAITAFSGDLFPLHLAMEKLALNFAGLLDLTLARLDLKENKLTAEVALEPFHPRQALELIKLEDKRLSDNLPAMADPGAFEQLSFKSNLQAGLAPFHLGLSDIELALDQSKLGGRAGLNAINSVYADLQLDSLDIDRYLPARTDEKSTQEQNRSKQTDTAESPDQDNFYSKEPLVPLDLLRRFKLDLALLADSLIFSQQTFTGIEAKLDNDSNTTSASLKARGMQGQAAINAGLANLAAVPDLAFVLELRGVDLVQAQALVLDEALLAGSGRLDVDLTATGVSAHDWAHSLGGTAAMDLAEGELLGMNVTRHFCDIASKTQDKKLSHEFSSENTDIERMQMRLVFDGNGRGEVSQLDVAVPNFAVTSVGQIDLPRIAFRLPLQIAIRGSKVDPACSVPGEITLPLLCEGRLFRDDPLSFCAPDLGAFERGIKNLLELEKQKIQQQLEERKQQVEERLEEEKQALQERAQEQQRRIEQQAEDRLKEEQKKAQEKIKENLGDQLKKLF